MGRAGKQPESPEMRAVRGAHELLGVGADADATELTRAYWRQARRLHPDLSSDPRATDQFRALHAAYQLALQAALQPRPPAPRRTGPGTPRADTDAASGWRGTTAARDLDRDVWIVAGPVHVEQPREGPRT
jgi:DnaJ-like protein